MHAVGLLNRMWGSRQDRFAKRVLAAVKEAESGIEAWYDADEFAVHYRARGDESPATAYLHNLYAEVGEAGRSEQRERIEHFIQALVFAPELPSEWQAVAPLLRPVLRPGTFGLGVGRGLVLQARSAGVPFLAEYVVIDRPASMAYVTTNHHEVWGVTEQEIFDTARANLTAVDTASEGEVGDGRALIRFVESGDAYWASRLLLAGDLRQLAERVGGRPVAFVPDTTAVVVVSDAPEAIARLFAMIEKEYREAVRPISPQAYTVDDAGQLQVYTPPAESAAAVAVHKAELLLAAAEYHSQADALATSERAFVAKLIIAERDDRFFSVASWADGVDTLLPRAEYIAFSGESEPFYTSWESVLAEVPMTPVPGLRPERYRARSWPAADVLDRLRANAVQL